MVDKEELLQMGEFDQKYLILTTGKGNELGYTLNLETRSFGKIASENTVSVIEFYPLDTDYPPTFKDTVLQVFDPEAQTRRGEYSNMQGQSLLASEKNNLEIKSVKKQGNWLYRVEATGAGLLELGQGYGEGWKAFAVSSYQLPVVNYTVELPNLKQELQHVKVNSWANGWMVDTQNCSNENSLKTDNCKLIIVFWPQLLEWGGALLGVMFLCCIIWL
jgi:hypothetical protein